MNWFQFESFFFCCEYTCGPNTNVLNGTLGWAEERIVSRGNVEYIYSSNYGHISCIDVNIKFFSFLLSNCCTMVNVCCVIDAISLGRGQIRTTLSFSSFVTCHLAEIIANSTFSRKFICVLRNSVL